MTRARLWLFVGPMLLAFVAVSAAAADSRTSLQNAYSLMYGFEFPSAERALLQWRLDNPRSPLGPVSLAANILFSELDRLGVLQAQFFVNDSSFKSDGGRMAPNAALRARFETVLMETEQMAHAALGRDGRDREALLALAFASGLRADYAALVEGRAREILVGLNRDFPANALFAREIRRIDTGGN